MLAPAADQALARRAVDRGANDSIVTDQIDTRSLVQLIAMMFERRASEEQKFVERERAEVTLNSIGDAVMTTDTLGNVTYLNAEAEGLTGWTRAEAFARPLAEVFDVTDGLTGQHAQDPSRLAIEHHKKVRLKGNYILVGRDGHETAIEHSAAPIHDRQGNILGAVIVFRDVIVSRERRLQMLHLAEHDALTDLPNRLLLNDRLARIDRAVAPLRPPPRGPVPRLRSLQAHQRHARPRHRRPGAALDREAPDDLRPRVGYRQPPRRRRVPDPAVGSRSAGGRRPDRREDRQLDRRAAPHRRPRAAR